MASVIVIFEAGSFPAQEKKKEKKNSSSDLKEKNCFSFSASAMGVPITPHPIKSV